MVETKAQPRGRLSAIPITGLLIGAAWCAFTIIDSSGNPGHYYQYRHSAEGFTYPTSSVIVWVSAIAVEVLVASWLVRRATSVPRMSLLLAITFGGLFLGTAVLAMHAAPYFTGHVMWLFLAAAWLLVATLVTGLVSYFHDRHSATLRVAARSGEAGPCDQRSPQNANSFTAG